MGAALGAFEGAGLLQVPRTRSAPVKTTNDLLAIRSDAYVLDDTGHVVPARDGPPFIDLDSAYFKKLPGFEARFPHGAPSLVDCERLVVHGDVTFGADVTVRGSVTVQGPRRVPDGAVLDG